MKFFLKLKHWQLFLLIAVLPYLLAVIGGMLLMPPGKGFLIAAASTLAPGFMAAFLLGWLYASGIFLARRLPVAASLRSGAFRLFIFFPLIYILSFAAFFTSVLVTGKFPFQPDARMFLVIVPLHLFAMFCMLYCLYFVAKTLKTAEMQRPLSFGDFAAEFFLLWFFPVGVWLLQPRINKLAKGEQADGATTGYSSQ